MTWRVECADVIEWAERYEGPPFMAILADPPYSLGDGKRGFMGRDWDTDVAFNPDTWAVLAEHLLPGAFGMAFASARGWHRLAVAIEDAGLRIHPSIFMLGFLYGSGFPKATRIKNAPAFEGHRYGLQCVKPALEPLIVFQKPYSKGKRTWESITETGAGALNIDKSRIASDTWIFTHTDKTSRSAGIMGQVTGARKGIAESHPQGRWPANFTLSHIDDHPCHRCGGGWDACPDCHGTGVVEGCRRVGTKRVESLSRATRGKGSWFGANGELQEVGYADPDGLETVAAWRCRPECPVRRLGEQSGVRQSGGYPSAGGQRSHVATYGRPNQRGEQKFTHSTGTAARFFFQADWSYEIAERLENADPVFYCPKSSRRERDAGLDAIKAQKLSFHEFASRIENGRITNERTNSPRHNPHPTVKPIALCKWLATLLAPPPEYAPRRLLVPFSGAGSEICAAILTGYWEEIVGIELLQENVDIAEARCRFWQTRMQETGSSDPRVILKASSSPGQMKLF